MKTTLTQVIRKYRCQPNQLLAALSSITGNELLHELVGLVSTGGLRLRSRRKDGKPSLCEQFYRYHAANPEVADWFLGAAQSLKHEERREHYGIGGLFERMRWDAHVSVSRTDKFKIPNDLQSCYVRQILMRDPSLCGFFELCRTSKADVLVVDGRQWTDFAQEHEAELWPEPTPRKRPTIAAQAEMALRETA